MPTAKPRNRHKRYLGVLEVAYAVHELAAISFPAGQRYGPMPSFQLIPRDGLGRLLSAIETPRQRFYRTIHEKAACLFRSLIKDHPLQDGNKRLAVLSLIVFLRLNGVDFKKSQDALVDFALEIASTEGNYPLDQVTAWIRAGCRGRPRKLVRDYAESWPIASVALMVKARRGDVLLGTRPRIPGRRVRVPYRLRSTMGRVKVLGDPHIYLKGGSLRGQAIVIGGAVPAGVTLTFAIGQRMEEYTLTNRRYRNRRVADFLREVPRRDWAAPRRPNPGNGLD